LIKRKIFKISTLDLDVMAPRSRMSTFIPPFTQC
jgi:hypothetical protein